MRTADSLPRLPHRAPTRSLTRRRTHRGLRVPRPQRNCNLPARERPQVRWRTATLAPLAVQDYRWIIEEDRTFYVDPNCASNPPPAGCPGASAGIVPTFGTNFATSHMPFIAQGCTGPISCEGGQTVLGNLRFAIWAMVFAGRTPQETAHAGSSQPGTSRSDEALLHLGSAGRRGGSVYCRICRRRLCERNSRGCGWCRLRRYHGWRSDPVPAAKHQSHGAGAARSTPHQESSRWPYSRMTSP